MNEIRKQHSRVHMQHSDSSTDYKPSSVVVAEHKNDSGKGVVYYVVQVYNEDASYTWDVHKRYSDFVTLKAGLLTAWDRTDGQEKLKNWWEFPPKTKLAPSKATVVDRQKKLETWLTNVLVYAAKAERSRNRMGQPFAHLEDFLKPEDGKPPKIVQAGPKLTSRQRTVSTVRSLCRGRVPLWYAQLRNGNL